MTDWQTRLNAKLDANREAREPPGEPKRCKGCRRAFRPVEPTCWTERKGPGREGPYCFECWERS
jgi:hypothetical protein